MASATQRSLQLLRKDGWQCQVVEKWQSFAKVRIDLFGCIDILAVKPGMVLGVQATTTSISAHVTKALNCGGLRGWLEGGENIYFEIWGWSKKGPRGKAKRWTLRRCPIVSRSGIVVPDIAGIIPEESWELP